MRLFSFLCRILKHKYKPYFLDENKTLIVYRCKRCGKNRDVYNEGETKNKNIRYFKKEDGKRNGK